LKIVIVGAGNAGCLTALHFAWHTRKDESIEIELVHNPNIITEKVGQATVQEPPKLLWSALGFDWYNNPIHATFKTGILYEGWGKKNEKWFHPFAADQLAMHYCPKEMQDYVLNSGLFKVTESDVDDISNIDADYIFDCRGKPKNYDDYHLLDHPINTCILAKPNWDTEKVSWSRHVATPDGWTFVIPTVKESPSNPYCVGYSYNDSITTKEDAEKNLLEMFDVEITKHVSFKNYIAKNPVIDDRIILNGNKFFFFEPLESTSVQSYLVWARKAFDEIVDKKATWESATRDMMEYLHETRNFILWHYHFGSKYNTPFWDYAKTIQFDDMKFGGILQYIKKSNNHDILPESYGGSTFDSSRYSQCYLWSLKNWYDGMTMRQDHPHQVALLK